VIDATGGLMRNPWAWTKVANLVALEAPGGVGYSYCDASLAGGECAYDDDTTAAANALALRAFFAKFPELAASAYTHPPFCSFSRPDHSVVASVAFAARGRL
jgi:carboxypeptidase C (cathepsin A)